MRFQVVGLRFGVVGLRFEVLGLRFKPHFFFHQSILCPRSTTPQARIAVTMSTTYNSNVMAEFRDHVVISSWTGSVTPAMQDMLRLTTNGTDFMQELLSTENQYRTALSVLSSAYSDCGNVFTDQISFSLIFHRQTCFPVWHVRHVPHMAEVVVNVRGDSG